MRRAIAGMMMWLALPVSCTFFAEEPVENPVARVGDHWLVQKDLESVAEAVKGSPDSILRIRGYVEDWAKSQLLLDRAASNISEEQQREFEALVEKYRSDLLINAYKEALVATSMDTAVAEADLLAYYEDNKQNFRLNDDLYTLRYVSVPPDFPDLGSLRERFKRFDEEDKVVLNEMALKFRFFSFNDSTWIKSSEIIKKIPAITTENKDRFLKKSQFFELSDSLGVYLGVVNEVLERNNTAPLDYVRPTVKKIILNKRKLDFLGRMEDELLREALRKKRFEVFDAPSKNVQTDSIP